MPSLALVFLFAEVVAKLQFRECDVRKTLV